MNAPGVESREGQMTQHRSNISSRREKNAERLATWTFPADAKGDW